MKKLFLFTFLLMGAGKLFAQSLEDITKLMDAKQNAGAKVAIDKFLSDPKNGANAYAWYYKGRIYDLRSHDADISKEDAYAYKLVSYDALKKYQQLDSKELLLDAENHRSFLNLYLGLYDIGAQQFNNKDFAGAYRSFVKAQEIENFMLAKNYTYAEVPLGRMDTTLVMNMAVSALQSNDTANAVMNYRRIADANITGKDYQEVYEYLTGYYNDHKDNANMQAMLAKGKAAYPEDSYWSALELQNLSQSGDKKAMFAGYEESFKKDPNNFINTYNYSAELYNYLYGKNAKDPDPAMKDKLTETLKAAMLNDKGVDATVLMVNHLYNDAAEYSSAAALVKGTKPDDIKKKKDLQALADAKMNETIPYGEAAIKYYSTQPSLTTRQKADYRTVAETMSDLYSAKGNAKKSKEYDDIKDSIKF